MRGVASVLSVTRSRARVRFPTQRLQLVYLAVYTREPSTAHAAHAANCRALSVLPGRWAMLEIGTRSLAEGKSERDDKDDGRFGDLVAWETTTGRKGLLPVFPS